MSKICNSIFWHLSLLLLCFNELNCQENITGKVIDAHTNEPIYGVIITLRDSLEGSIKSFVKTGIDGSFNLKLKPQKLVIVQFQKLEYKKKIIPLSEVETVVKLEKSQEKITAIEEVIVNTKRDYFRSNNDKVVVDAKNYRDSIGTRLEDLIGNIPGVSLNRNNGDIYYKGQQIQTVLIDGSNISSNNYKEITQNVDQNIADKIEIITDYSENTVLESFINSKDIALNIITDKKKGKFTGVVEAAYGPTNWFKTRVNSLYNKNNLKALLNAEGQNIAVKSWSIYRNDKSYHKNLSLSEYNLGFQSPMLPLGYEQSVVGYYGMGIINKHTNFKISPNFYTRIKKNQSILVNYLGGQFDGENESFKNYSPISGQLKQIEDKAINKYKDRINRIDIQYDAVFIKKIQLRAFINGQLTHHSSNNLGVVNNIDYQKGDTTSNEHLNSGISVSALLGKKHALSVTYNETRDKQNEEIIRNAQDPFPYYNSGDTTYTKNIFQERNIRNKTRYVILNYAYKLKTNSFLYASYYNNNIKQKDSHSSIFEKRKFPNFATNNFNSNSFALQWKYATKKFSYGINLINSVVNWKKNVESKFTPNISINFKDDISWNMSAYLGRYLVLSPLKQQTKLTTYTSSFLMNQQFYDHDIANISDRFSLNLNKAWLRSYQESGIKLFMENQKNDYINKISSIDEFVLQQNELKNNDRNYINLNVSHAKYFRKYRSNLKFSFDRNSNIFSNIIDDIQWYNNIISYRYKVEFKSAFKFPINFMVDFTYSKNYYKKRADENTFKENWQSYSIRNILKAKLIPNYLNLRIEHTYTYLGDSDINMLNCLISWKSILKSFDAKVRGYNILNKNKIETKSFKDDYLISQGQLINSRAILFELAYKF